MTMDWFVLMCQISLETRNSKKIGSFFIKCTKVPKKIRYAEIPLKSTCFWVLEKWRTEFQIKFGTGKSVDISGLFILCTRCTIFI